MYNWAYFNQIQNLFRHEVSLSLDSEDFREEDRLLAFNIFIFK